MLSSQRLFLASGSASRKKLLQDCGFSLVEIAHACDECAIGLARPVHELVQVLANAKMDHVCLPLFDQLSDREKRDGIIVLTADTLVVDADGVIHGKPKDHADAVYKIKKLRDGAAYVQSGFAIQRFCLGGGMVRSWSPVGARVSGYDSARVFFEIEDTWIESYLRCHSIAYRAAGGMAIEGFGALFLTALEGSYATVIGLPLHRVRRELDRMGFFD